MISTDIIIILYICKAPTLLFVCNEELKGKQNHRVRFNKLI